MSRMTLDDDPLPPHGFHLMPRGISKGAALEVPGDRRALGDAARHEVEDVRRQRVVVQRHPRRRRDGAVVLHGQPAQVALGEPRVDRERVDPAAQQGVRLVRGVPGRVPLQPAGMRRRSAGRRRRARPSPPSASGRRTPRAARRQPVSPAAGVPGDRGAQLGDGAVGGEDPRRLDDLLERPPADQHQRRRRHGAAPAAPRPDRRSARRRRCARTSPAGRPSCRRGRCRRCGWSHVHPDRYGGGSPTG